jgi:hypothetical protein
VNEGKNALKRALFLKGAADLLIAPEGVNFYQSRQGRIRHDPHPAIGRAKSTKRSPPKGGPAQTA